MNLQGYVKLNLFGKSPAAVDRLPLVLFIFMCVGPTVLRWALIYTLNSSGRASLIRSLLLVLFINFKIQIQINRWRKDVTSKELLIYD